MNPCCNNKNSQNLSFRFIQSRLSTLERVKTIIIFKINFFGWLLLLCSICLHAYSHSYTFLSIFSPFERPTFSIAAILTLTIIKSSVFWLQFSVENHFFYIDELFTKNIKSFHVVNFTFFYGFHSNFVTLIVIRLLHLRTNITKGLDNGQLLYYYFI